MGIMDIVWKQSDIEWLGLMTLDEVNGTVGLYLHAFPAFAGNDLSLPQRTSPVNALGVRDQPIAKSLK